MGDRLDAARSAPESLEPKAEAALLIALAPHLEDFLAQLFGIAPEVQALEATHHELAPLFAVKRQFVQRKAANAHKADEAATFDGAALRAALEGRLGAATVRARRGTRVRPRGDTAGCRTKPRTPTIWPLAARYAAWSLHTPAGRAAARAACCFARRASSTT